MMRCLPQSRVRVMSNLLFLRRSLEYRHAALMAFQRARAMPFGSERSMARELARGLRDLARTEAWLEGQTPHVRRIPSENHAPPRSVASVGA